MLYICVNIIEIRIDYKYDDDDDDDCYNMRVIFSMIETSLW